MRGHWGVLLWIAASLHAGDGLGGAIVGGKAKQLVDRAVPLLKEADDLYKRFYVLDEGTEGVREAAMKRAVELYDRATGLLQEALEIQEDGPATAQLTHAARKLAKVRAWLVHLEMARRIKERPPTPPEPDPAPAPAPQPPAPKPPAPAPPPVPRFPEGEPPATPVDVVPAATGEFDDSAEKQDLAAIHARIQDYYQAQRPNKLLYRHRLCAGKGRLGGGAPCAECGGTGRAINLHHFRKVFWTSYSPMLRSADGALAALTAYYERARKDPALFGPAVKAAKVLDIEYHGMWARARVKLSTDEGTEERTLTLVSVGSTWFLYHPDTDAELLPEAPE